MRTGGVGWWWVLEMRTGGGCWRCRSRFINDWRTPAIDLRNVTRRCTNIYHDCHPSAIAWPMAYPEEYPSIARGPESPHRAAMARRNGNDWR